MALHHGNARRLTTNNHKVSQLLFTTIGTIISRFARIKKMRDHKFKLV